MASLSDLRPKVMVNAPGCPLPLVDDAILDAVIDFCNRSRAYRYTPAQITVVAGTADYTPTIPAGTVIASLISAELDDEPIDIALPGNIPASWATEQGSPTAAVRPSKTQVGLRKVPDVAGTLDVVLALRPALTGTSYPDELHDLYREQIAAGALARLYVMPNKPWSAPDLVNDARANFDAGISAAEYQADRGSANAPARTALSLIGGR